MAEEDKQERISTKGKILFGVVFSLIVAGVTLSLFQINTLIYPSEKIVIDKDNNGTLLLTFSSLLSEEAHVKITVPAEIDSQMHVDKVMQGNLYEWYSFREESGEFIEPMKTESGKNRALLSIAPNFSDGINNLKPGECRVYEIVVDAKASPGVHTVKKIEILYLYDAKDLSSYYHNDVCDIR